MIEAVDLVAIVNAFFTACFLFFKRAYCSAEDSDGSVVEKLPMICDGIQSELFTSNNDDFPTKKRKKKQSV